MHHFVIFARHVSVLSPLFCGMVVEGIEIGLGLRFRNQAAVGRAVESTEKESLFARLLHLAASLADALKQRVELTGREAADEDVATLAVLAQHSVASGTTQGERPVAVGMIEHAHGYEVKHRLLVTFLLLQDFLFRHIFLSQILNFFDRLTAVSSSRCRG